MARGSLKRQQFINAYLRSGDSVRAAQEAGYGPLLTSIRSKASQLLRHPEVQEAVQKHQERLAAETEQAVRRAGMGAQEVLERIADIARFGKTEATRLKALELAAKTHALLTEHHAIETRQRAEMDRVTYPAFNELPPGTETLLETPEGPPEDVDRQVEETSGNERPLLSE